MRTLGIETYLPDDSSGHIHMMHICPVADEQHTHDFFELVYVVHGSANHRMGEERSALHAGDFFVIDTGSSHSYEAPVDFEIVNCLFLPEYAGSALENCPSLSALLSNKMLRFGVPVDLKAADRICHDSDGSVLEIIQKMEQEYCRRPTGYMEMLRCYLTQLLVYTVRAVSAAATVHEATAAMVSHLREHLSQPLSLSAMSHQLGYTPQYLSSLFKKDMGMTLQTFLQRLRTEEAVRLLSAGDMTLPEIAQAVGYSDVKHFSRVFRAHMGSAPRQFKKTCRPAR